MKECDIRPKEILDEYLELSLKDGKAIQEKSETFVDIPCPACGSNDRTELFPKNDFKIQRCSNCKSLYCSPRPSEDQLKNLYEDSESSRYWTEVFFPTVAQARREKLFKPKAQSIYDLLVAKNFVPKTICDVGAGYGLLLDELKQFWPDAGSYAIEPSGKSAEVCRQKGFQLLGKTVEQSEEWKERFDLLTCFEVIEHVYDPRVFIRSIYRLIKPGGYGLVTGLCGDGFDIQTLGRRSKSVFPPHHINFLSIEGLQILFKEAGFCEISITTPGKLDVDIVNNALNEGNGALPLFLETLLRRGQRAQDDFQEFLVKHKLSSHVWILAKRIN